MNAQAKAIPSGKRFGRTIKVMTVTNDNYCQLRIAMDIGRRRELLVETLPRAEWETLTELLKVRELRRLTAGMHRIINAEEAEQRRQKYPL